MPEAGLERIARLLSVLRAIEEMRIHAKGYVGARVPQPPGDVDDIQLQRL